MWQVKVFKTRKAMLNWIDRNGHKVQWHEVFVNNAWAVDYRPLRVIG